MFCHSFLYIDNYRFMKQLLSSFTRSVVIVTLVHPDIEKQAWYSSHIWSPAGPERVLKPFHKAHSQ